uniref:Uncharacterized protein n=1 Tax=Parascaris equorum TaxID=6256 RepID=A0A914REM0_PAREQ
MTSHMRSSYSSSSLDLTVFTFGLTSMYIRKRNVI